MSLFIVAFFSNQATIEAIVLTFGSVRKKPEKYKLFKAMLKALPENAKLTVAPGILF
jgi:hypothetical protein